MPETGLGTRMLCRLVSRDPDERTIRTMSLIARILGNHRYYIGLVLSINVLIALFEGSSIGLLALAVASVTSPDGTVSIGPGFMTESVNKLVESLGRDKLFLVLVLLAVGGQLLRAGLQYGGLLASTYLQTRILEDTRNAVMRQIMRMSFRQVSQYPSGVLASFAGQTTKASTIVDALNMFISQAFLLMVYSVLLAAISWQMTLVALVLSVVFSFSLARIVANLRRIGKESLRASIQLSKNMFEFLQAPRLIRLFSREDYVLDSLKKTLAAEVRATREGMYWKGLITPLLDSMTVIAGASVLVGGYWLLRDDVEQVLPTLLAFVLVLQRVMVRLGSLNNARAAIVHSLAPAEVVAELLDDSGKEFTRREGQKDFKFGQKLEFREVTFHYPGSAHTVLDEVSFTVEKGAFIAIVGQSGAGKTTIVDLLVGLFEPTQGVVLMDDLPLRDASLPEWRRNFGIVSQDSFMFNASIKENITFADENAPDDEVEQALRSAHAFEFVSLLKDGMHTLVGDRGYSLSGGQIQRLALARALYTGAEILVLDEATSALDAVSEKLIMQSIKELKKKKTIVMVTHRLVNVTEADEVVVLKAGRIAERGTHAQLLRMNGSYADFWRIQMAVEQEEKLRHVAGIN